MFPLAEKDKPVARMLLRTGTCPRCIFRFCCVDFQAPYRLPYKELLTELQNFLKTEKDDQFILEATNPPLKKIRLQDPKEETVDLGQNGVEVTSVLRDGLAMETANSQACNVCLGVLQEFCEKDFIKKVCQKVDSSGYQFANLVFSVSFPPQLSVREHAAWLLVKQEMGKQGLLLERDGVIQLKEAYKWITHPLFSEELGVPVDGKSPFEVCVIFAHPETDEDCHFLVTVCPDCFKPTKNKQSVFTRMAVVKALEKIKEKDFRKWFPCPPSLPKAVCTALEIQCAHSAVFVAGRYNKYSRNLPQTPWIIDGERKLESSVEELISDHLVTMFKAESFNFSSSGREDVDVRTLGNGRPFAIELLNPHRVHFTSQEMRELQQTINSASDKIKVRDLQLVTREAIAHMKEGEEEKTKTYSALVWTDRVIQKKDIEFLDDTKDLKIDQKTPLRVLHRRPLAVRTRLIHTMETQYIDEHHFRLRLKTQAGTYIKEFVHGDFGRTTPNIGFLMNGTADILELDVESVDVDWPPPLDD
ncbi:tRNA pseudouridine synthase Pus10 isoform X1 [Ornithorhynchus anatinus]|uniref:tRNA pseudouridine synthase Pus10 isoform X1 n=2 Tax=Ornithorhynchus anatinus TaxID=9258 RepID=UPI000454C0B3|nr:tRNA pseudouridine synthase Pus10 isoform X1 [Ornithorhynchus anatinus]XP_028928057.1 tRNA pseudouridine synthase Pus10 isoform X1 [Ornithorhynchus anatinus]XP_028928058.1 tRNA pseudouridine synthase Pus10 isoform X1 [Ornithorhynchus anatinus]